MSQTVELGEPPTSPVASPINIVASLAPKVTFASHQNAVPVLRGLRIENRSSAVLENLTVTISADPLLIAPKVWKVDRLRPGTQTEITDRDTKLNGALLLDVRESLTGTIRIVVEQAGRLLAEHVAPVEVLARNEWGGAGSMPELLAAFVTPNDPAVDNVLRAASTVLTRAGKPGGITGYVDGSAQRTWELTSAIWSAVASMQLAYSLPPASFEVSGQKVRTPSDITGTRLATCLDTSLLFAAALEQAGLNPLLIIVPGHAFVAVWLDQREFPQVLTQDVTALRKRIALRELVAFETTLAAQTPPSAFSVAVKAANQHLETDAFHFALDIRRARMQRIRPLALEVKHASNSEPTTTRVAESFEDAPILPEGSANEDEAKPTTPQGRIDHWQRKLLDLTTRNRLLNAKPSATMLRLVCPDPAKLEDLLAADKRIKIVPLPDLAGSQGRDASVHFARTGEQLLDEYAREALERCEVLSPLDAKTLDANLVELYRKAKLDLIEGGANTLFLAVGFLRWKKAPDEQQTYRAPLVLLPVTLERKSALSGVRMAAHEDEARFNLTLLQLLKQDFELAIPELEGELPTDESGVDVPRIWTSVKRAVRDVPGFEVVEEIALGTFSFAKYLMWKDLVDRSDLLKENDVVRHLIETPREAFRVPSEFPRPEQLDATVTMDTLFTPLPSDSSQLTAIVASARGLNFVLDGPPGTGKSQTIANIIAHNLGLGRKVLFVAEKMAALDVVHRRLEERGLGAFCLELHSAKANKAEVLKQLGRVWDTKERIPEAEWKQSATKLQNIREELNELVRILHTRHRNGMTLHSAIGRAVRDADARTPALAWPPERQHDERTLETLRDVARRLDVNYAAVAKLDQRVFASIDVAEWSNAWQAEIVASATAVVHAADRLGAARAEIWKALGLPSLGGTRDGLTALGVLGKAAIASAGINVAFAFEPNAKAISESALRAITHLEAYRSAINELSVPYPKDAARTLPIASLAAQWNAADASFWPLSVFKRSAARKALMSAGNLAAKPDVAKDLPTLARAQHELLQLDSLQGVLAQVPTWTGASTDITSLKRSLDVADNLRTATSALATSPQALVAIKAAVRKACVDGNELLDDGMPTSRAVETYTKSLEEFAATVAKFEITSGRTLQSSPNEDFVLAARQRCAELVRGQLALKSWCDWRRVRGQAVALDLSKLVSGLESGQYQAGEVAELFEVAYAKWWAGVQIDSEPRLRNFVAAEHADKIESFRKVDDHLTTLSASVVVGKLCQGIPARDDVKRESGYGVLRHELTKRMRYKPVRQLLSEMGPSFMRLAPCLLMSPLSIAQYLPADSAMFDLVIFDEASQIATWDAVGAIARGKQVIIAGDPKQMPPTSFFSRSTTSPDDGDDEVPEDMESILDECLGASIPRHRLTWHYRSKHESLIAFSNHRYYDGELITFPASVTRESAVSWRRIEGVYAKGKGRTNQMEAQAIVAEVVKRLLDPAFGGAGKSLAVITLNAEQQRLIEDLIDVERQKNPMLEPFFGDVTEPVIVKNLETIQGDERDLVLVGIGYGPDTPGATTMSMNFGPLNRSGGWRRLNVAVTRAREEAIIFTSFSPDMIDLNRTSAEAVRDLRHFLEFAQRGPKALAEAVKGSVGGFESPFEEAVARGLRERGWTVVPQIGVSRFRIDLGIVHPDRPGDYLCGVECDGAAYHSAATARDRDKVRSRILDGLGWTLVRVWSTDWWVDAATALERLDRQIRDLRGTAVGENRELALVE